MATTKTKKAAAPNWLVVDEAWVQEGSDIAELSNYTFALADLKDLAELLKGSDYGTGEDNKIKFAVYSLQSDPGMGLEVELNGVVVKGIEDFE